MDSLYNNNNKNSKIPKLKLKMKLKPLNGNVSPLNPYSPENLNTDSPLMKFLRSKSPMATDSFSSPSIKHQYSSSSSSGNSSRGSSEKKTPLFEDVLVMDGISIGSGHGSRVLRSGSDHKLEICRAWEDFGHCRFASKCQFAHGKEELRPTRFPMKNKSEVMCKSYSSVGSCPYGPKCRFVHQIMPEAVAATTQMVTPTKHEQTSKSPSTTTKPECTSKTPTSTIKSEHTSKTPSTTTKPEHTSKTPTSITPIKPKLASKSPGAVIKPEDSCKTTTSTITSRDWSPFDDGIEVPLPSHADKLPSREEIDARIDNILYGPTTRRRLPVFTQIPQSSGLFC